jgi:hypothetical protein
VFSEPNAFAATISGDLVAVSEARWFRLALVFMTGIIVGLLLASSAGRLGKRKAFGIRSLGYKFLTLSDSIKTRTAASGWPDNVRDLKPAIKSALTTAGQFKLWAPNDRVYELPDASFLCEY